MKILYVMEHFPRKVSQTFVVNEMVALIQLQCEIEIAAFSSDNAIHGNILRYKLMDRLHKIYGMSNPFLRLLKALWKFFILVLFHPLLSVSMLRHALELKLKMNEIIHVFVAVPCLLNVKNVDIVHVPFPSSAIISACEVFYRLTKIPFTATYRAGEIYSNSITQKYSPLCAQFITISNYNKKALVKKVPHNADIKIIHSAIDVSLFKSGLRQVGKTPFKILCVGRFVEKKGIAFLIDAIKLLIDSGLSIQACIVGEGPLKEEYLDQIRRCGLSDVVSITDPLPNEKITELLSSSSVFALPCVIAEDGDRDILPNVLKEAMAMEVPVITTNISGIEELIEDGKSGFLIPERDARALASKMKDVATMSSEALREVGNNGRERVLQDFDVKSEAGKLCILFKGVISA